MLRAQYQEDSGPETFVTFKQSEIKPKSPQPKQGFILGAFTSSRRQCQHPSFVHLKLWNGSKCFPTVLPTNVRFLKHTRPPCDDNTRPEDTWKAHGLSDASNKLQVTNLNSPLCPATKQERVTTSAVLPEGQGCHTLSGKSSAGYTHNNICHRAQKNVKVHYKTPLGCRRFSFAFPTFLKLGQDRESL